MSGLVNTYGSKTGLCGREYAWRIGMASSGNVSDNGTIFMNRTNGNGAFLRNVSWASDKIKIPVTGWYDLSFQVESTANAVNIIIYYYDFTNDKGLVAHRKDEYKAESDLIGVSTQQYLAAGIEVGLRSSSGGTRFFVSGSDSDGTWMMGRYLQLGPWKTFPYS